MGPSRRNIISDVLPDIEVVAATLPEGTVEHAEELRTRLELAYVTTQVDADAGALEDAIAALRARAGGDTARDPFGARIDATSFDDLAAAGRSAAANRLDLATVLALQYESGSIAAAQGQRLVLFLGVNAEARRLMWAYGTASLVERGEPHERFVELGRWLLLWSEMSSLAITEGYRATERELLSRDAVARRAALDELLSAPASEIGIRPRLRRLSMKYGLDPDSLYRLVAILPGLNIDPTADQQGLDDQVLDDLARRIDHLIRRQGVRERPGTGITVPLAATWRGSIVAILGRDRQEFSRLTHALRDTLGDATGGDDQSSWVAIATEADGVQAWPQTIIELQESLRVARRIGRHGVVGDMADLGVERLLLSDPDLAATIIERELGALLADARMGDELIETVEVYFDAGNNRREAARRLHLADRTVAYRLERVKQLLGHGLEGEPGRRLNVALTLRRLAEAQLAAAH